MKKFLIVVAVVFSSIFSLQTQARDLPDFTELVEKQGAAVVNISTTQVIKGRRGGHPFQFEGDEAAQEFLRRFFPGHATPPVGLGLRDPPRGGPGAHRPDVLRPRRLQ